MQKNVEIINYSPIHQAVFQSLNEAWISAYFAVEEEDRRMLCHPEEHIIACGGKIYVALLGGEPVGVCALIKTNDPLPTYELAKMAVAPQAQGKRIGWLLACHAVDSAKRLGAAKLYLESNTVLAPAINLYKKLGFREIAGRPSPYQRVIIHMELDLR